MNDYSISRSCAYCGRRFTTWASEQNLSESDFCSARCEDRFYEEYKEKYKEEEDGNND